MNPAASPLSSSPSLRLSTTRRAGNKKDQKVSLPSIEDDEKGNKLRKRDQNRATQVAVFLGILSLIFLVATVKLHHTPHKRSVRLGTKVTMETQKTHLPPNSIYRLSAKNGSGTQTPLEQYAGMVSLVVNVASL
jgi:hypothetical protein